MGSMQTINQKAYFCLLSEASENSGLSWLINIESNVSLLLSFAFDLE